MFSLHTVRTEKPTYPPSTSERIVMFPCWTWSFLWKTFLRIWHQDTKCKTELYFRTKNKICEATLFWCSKIQRIQIWKSNKNTGKGNGSKIDNNFEENKSHSGCLVKTTHVWELTMITWTIMCVVFTTHVWILPNI